MQQSGDYQLNLVLCELVDKCRKIGRLFYHSSTFRMHFILKQIDPFIFRYNTRSGESDLTRPYRTLLILLKAIKISHKLKVHLKK